VEEPPLPELSDVELMVLAWKNGGKKHQPTAPTLPPIQPIISRTAQLHKQLDLTTIRQEIGDLRQEIDRQDVNINQIRRQLPRGWYRRSNSTLDLEIRPVVTNDRSSPA
jgi:hypothetical protein